MFYLLMVDPESINAVTPYRSQPPGVGPSLLQKTYSEVSTLPLQQLSGPKEASSCAMFHSICQEVGDDEGIDKFEAGWGLITGE